MYPLLRCWREEDGQDLVEYALLLAMLALGTISVLTATTGSTTPLWRDIANGVNSAVSAAS